MEAIFSLSTEYEYDPAALIRARKVANLTQEEAARQAGMHEITLTRIEGGTKTTSDRIVALCKVYNISVASVVRNADILPESLKISKI